MTETPVLQIRGLDARYGTSRILQGIDLTVRSEPVAVIGRNGMGKTTLCHAIMGMGPICDGSIRFDGVELVGRPSHQIAKRGISLVPQGRHIFRSLTVEEHLQLVDQRRPRRWTRDRVYQVFPRLAERRQSTGSALSGGEQQMLAVGRALLTNPRLLIMDEPSEGLAPIVVDKLVATLQAVLAEGTALLLIEQNLSVAAAVSERLAVMVVGRIALETSARELLADTDTQQRLLGIGAAAGFAAAGPTDVERPM
ncbi:MAG: ABC transporter ATP-binding protein [candidate division Zixibacteria bacterium RBG_16_53_22]|nr:MAG: ABC transporter ATP-binding protein [candidate division Zixibacteria bacterium RBG_16_53_22]